MNRRMNIAEYNIARGHVEIKNSIINGLVEYEKKYIIAHYLDPMSSILLKIGKHKKKQVYIFLTNQYNKSKLVRPVVKKINKRFIIDEKLSLNEDQLLVSLIKLINHIESVEKEKINYEPIIKKLIQIFINQQNRTN